jgi:DNA ligase (NAD+)
MNLQLQIQQYLEAKEKYYLGEPIMSDEKFDELEEQLIELGYDPKVGLVDTIVSDSDKVEHKNKVLSLSKQKVLEETMSIEIAEKLFSNYGLSDLSWKYDGLAICLNYENGQLIDASTRGNGTLGRNVMYKVKGKVPQTISSKENVELRFEAVMKNQIFNTKYSEKYSHPRNLVAGIFNDITETDERIDDVDFVLLEAISHDGYVLPISQFQEFQHKSFVKIDSAESLKQAFDEASANRSTYSYGTDGMVLTSVDVNMFEHNGHHPKHAIAIKFMPPKLISTITKISWTLHRTGNYKPIIHFEQIIVDGRSIKKASGYNLAYFIENDLKFFSHWDNVIAQYDLHLFSCT